MLKRKLPNAEKKLPPAKRAHNSNESSSEDDKKIALLSRFKDHSDAIEDSFNYPGDIRLKNLAEEITTEVLSFDNAVYLLKRISYYLRYSKNDIAQQASLREILSKLASHALYSVNFLLSEDKNHFVEWIQNIDHAEAEIGYLFFDSGYVVKTRTDSLEHPDQKELLLNVEGEFAAGDIDFILDYLINLKLNHHQNVSSKTIAMVVCSCGFLAKTGKILGQVDAKKFMQLLHFLLAKTDMKAVSISNFFSGIGYIAHSNCLQGYIEAAQIESLLDELYHSHPTIKEICFAFEGIGNLAYSGHLEGDISANNFDDFFGKIKKNITRMKKNHIVLFLLSINRLAQAQKLKGQVKASLIEEIILSYKSKSLYVAEDFSFALNHARIIAESGFLQGRFQKKFLINLLYKIAHAQNFKPRYFSHAFLEIGLIANANALQAAITINDLKLALDLVLNQERGQFNLDQLSLVLTGLSWLSSKHQLDGFITANQIENFFDKLLAQPNWDNRTIHIIFLSLWILLVKNTIEGSISATKLELMLKRVLDLPDLGSNTIAQAFFFVATIKRDKKLNGSFQISLIKALLEKQLPLNPTIAEAQKCFVAIGFFNEKIIDVDTFLKLFSIIVNIDGPYLHPKDAAELIYSFVVYKDKVLELNEAFHTLMSYITVELKRFSSKIQKTLEKSLQDLASVHLWHEALSNRLLKTNKPTQNLKQQVSLAPLAKSIPRQSNRNGVTSSVPISYDRVQRPSHHEIYHPINDNIDTQGQPTNLIFKAISDKNVLLLKRLLHLEDKAFPIERSRRRLTPASPETSKLTEKNVIKNNQQIVERDVVCFLKQTKLSELRHLISQSHHTFFALLLDACSEHTRYQLAQSNALHPILLYLPIKDLSLMIDQIISPFKLYVDHHALIHLIDALVIRFDENPEEQNEILKLQYQLIDRGIAFHQQCNHMHVSEKLIGVRAGIVNKNLTLVGDEDISQSISALSYERNHLALENEPAPSVQQTQSAPLPKVNCDYFYQERDIQAILRCRFYDNPNVHLLAPVQFESASPIARIGFALESALFDLPVMDETQKNHFIIPIHLSRPEHWIGVVLELTGNAVTKVTYTNSLASNLDKNRIETIKSEIVELINPDCPFSPYDSMQQKDGSSCGAYLVENCFAIITNNTCPKSTSTFNQAEAIRLRHLEVLEEHDPIYYEDFKVRQFSEVTDVNFDVRAQERAYQLRDKQESREKEQTSSTPPSLSSSSLFNKGIQKLVTQNQNPTTSPSEPSHRIK